MTIYGRSEELVSRCIECDLAEPESLTSLGGSAPGLVDGILSEFIEEGIKSVLLRKRCTQQKLAKSMGVSKTTVHCWIVELTLCVHSNSLKPILTEENRLARFEMAMDSRDLVDQTKYQDIHDQIHVDEKWFFSCRRRKGTFSIKMKKPKALHQTQIAYY